MSRIAAAQAYYAPELAMVVKLERVSQYTYIVHYEDGPERIPLKDFKNNWKHLGTWDKYVSDNGSEVISRELFNGTMENVQ